MEKTKLVDCKDKDRRDAYLDTKFDFLGYAFKGIIIKDRSEQVQINFLASVGKKSCKAMLRKIKEMEIHKETGSKLEMIAKTINPIIGGRMNYYGRDNKSAIKNSLDCMQRRLADGRWANSNDFNGTDIERTLIKKVQKREPGMFAHWAPKYI